MKLNQIGLSVFSIISLWAKININMNICGIVFLSLVISLNAICSRQQMFMCYKNDNVGCTKSIYANFTHICTTSAPTDRDQYCCCKFNDSQDLCCRYMQSLGTFRCNAHDDSYSFHDIQQYTTPLNGKKTNLWWGKLNTISAISIIICPILLIFLLLYICCRYMNHTKENTLCRKKNIVKNFSEKLMKLKQSYSTPNSRQSYPKTSNGFNPTNMQYPENSSYNYNTTYLPQNSSFPKYPNITHVHIPQLRHSAIIKPLAREHVAQNPNTFFQVIQNPNSCQNFYIGSRHNTPIVPNQSNPSQLIKWLDKRPKVKILFKNNHKQNKMVHNQNCYSSIDAHNTSFPVESTNLLALQRTSPTSCTTCNSAFFIPPPDYDLTTSPRIDEEVENTQSNSKNL
ncbi:hypothetical protein A3Q56_00723 [Intoshia linei]|uniref:Uncharacterized protein n=1 Tax=Intoshia linei TaxID=1819745 RepID=A0A177BB17_9BILA|nr:hypothetical protein A3Q56_00723 [Intoshia linei]